MWAPGRGYVEYRVFLDGAPIGRGGRFGCSLGFGDNDLPAKVLLPTVVGGRRHARRRSDQRTISAEPNAGPPVPQGGKRQSRRSSAGLRAGDSGGDGRRS